MCEKENEEIKKLENEKDQLFSKIDELTEKQNKIRKTIAQKLVDLKVGSFYQYHPYPKDIVTSNIAIYFYWDEKCTKEFDEIGMKLKITNAIIERFDSDSYTLSIEAPYILHFRDVEHLINSLSIIKQNEFDSVCNKFKWVYNLYPQDTCLGKE